MVKIRIGSRVRHKTRKMGLGTVRELWPNGRVSVYWDAETSRCDYTSRPKANNNRHYYGRNLEIIQSAEV